MTRQKTSSGSFEHRRFPVYAILLAIVLIAGAAFLLTRTSPAETRALPPEISVSQAAQLRDQGAWVLDVRQPEEWNELHVPGATLIPLDQLPQRISEVPKDKEIVVICRSGNRSQAGRDILLQAGYEKVTSVSGGIIAWRNAGYPTVSGP
ncbi:rhodanese-related sulfurtransferase [Bellilinea caldifistulae]|uniref:rhodanese-like domain-containing protein n=1 Tax=Bellilinea caldifistulae TaxID=360411 RepID=UPI00078073DE|nr:rhodanese-like domain-containing protein [Bellilinea caldifistulae]GAP09865.1 rhodanese-related sulfurtransferase [Bellilinea caldifistulae]